MKNDRFISLAAIRGMEFDLKYLAKRGGLFYVIILCLAVFLAFYPSLTNDFQWEWDDQWMVLQHPMILDHSFENLWYYFTHYDIGQYFPLNQLYYLGIYGLFGFSPTAFHWGSLLLHLFNTLLVFYLVRIIAGMITGHKNRININGIAGLVALIFAIHPLQVEAVAWISASKVLLYTTFTLGCLISYLYYKRNHNIIFLILTFVGYILSLMTKEQAIILPLNLVLMDFVLHSYGKVKFSGKVLLEKTPFFILAILFWYWSVQNDLGVVDLEMAYSWDKRLVFGSYSLIVYVIRFMVPVNLLYFYGFPIVVGESLSWFYFSYVILGFLFLLYLVDLYRSKRYMPFFGLLFFLINISLVLHILPMPRTMITADRYMYLSIVGLSVWGVWGLYRLYHMIPKITWIRYGLVTGLGVLLIGFVIYSNVLTRKWESSDTIKQEVRNYLQPAIFKKQNE